MYFTRTAGTYADEAALQDPDDVIELTGTGGALTIAAYVSDATYSRGSANSVVTHDNHVWVYRSTQRNTNHDPEQYPQYWWKLDTPIRVLDHDSATVGHWRSGEIFLTETGQLRMCTATISASPADIISMHTGTDQEFLWLNEAGGGGFTLRQGTTAPANSLGDDDDWYLRTSNGQWYQKASGSWVSRYTDQVGQAGGGLTAVATTANITGDGTSSDPLDIAAGGVTEDKIEDDAVTEAKIENGAVAEDKLAEGAARGGLASDVNSQLNPGATRDQAALYFDDADETIQAADTAAKFTALVPDDAITGDKIADNTIHGGALVDGTIATGKIGNSQVTGAKLSSNAVSSGKLATGAVTTAKIADGAVTSDELAANAAGEGKVPIDNTMQFDGSGDLGVNTQRVVQEVSEWVQHFATGDGHDTSGHSGKYHEYTSPNTHRRIGSVQYDFDPQNDSSGGGTGKTYQVFILELTGRNIDVILGSSAVYSGNSLQHRFHFTDGVMINPNVRIGIGLHRTDGGNNEGLSVRAGAESQDSPRESYDDASNDFNFVGRFNHDRPTPSVNDTVGGTAANQIYGNPEIFYQIIHTHDSLVGDGTVSSAHISSGSAADGEVLTADGSGGTAWEAAAGGGSGGAIYVASSGVSLVNSDANHIELTHDDIPDPPTEGTRIVFVPSNDNTGGVEIRIGSDDYTLQKSNEPNSGHAAMSSGDIEGQQPFEMTYSGSAFWWTGGVSGSASRSNSTGGEDGHSPVFSSGDAFPTSPSPVESDFHFFFSDVASGLDWKDTDESTDLTSADAGDVARFDGTDWVKQGNLRGPAGDDGADGAGGGVTVGDPIGTHRMVNSYTTSRMYETTVPTPASDDGDLLVITFAPDATSPDNAIGGSEIAFVPLANVLAIPNAYTGSGSADSEGSNRDSLRTGFGQNDWLYIGVTVVAGGNLTIGSTDAKYAGVFTFRVLSYGAAGGQQSPGNEGVAEQTPDLVTVVLYQWFDDAVDPIPSNPTAHWRFDDEWDGTTPFQGGGWFTSRIDAGAAADNNPDFDEASWTLWVATEQTRRKVNSDDEYYYTDGGYSVYSVFDDHYSVNSNGSWHPTFEDGDKWMRLRTAVGGFTRPIPLSGVTEVVWQPLVSEAAIYQRGPEVDEAETYDISPAIDISAYDQLRFTMRTVKVANDVEQAAMQVYDFIVHRPPDGWNVFSPGALSLQEGTYQFHYDNTIPNGLVIFRLVLSQITTATGDGREADIDIPDAVRNDGGEGFNKTAGRFKFLGTSEENVTGIYLFDNPRNTSAWQQIQWWVYGLGVA